MIKNIIFKAITLAAAVAMGNTVLHADDREPIVEIARRGPLIFLAMFGLIVLLIKDQICSIKRTI